MTIALDYELIEAEKCGGVSGAKVDVRIIKKQLITFLRRELRDNNYAVIPELARKLGYTEKGLLKLFQTLNGRITAELELEPFINGVL